MRPTLKTVAISLLHPSHCVVVLTLLASFTVEPLCAQPTHIVGQDLMVRGYIATRVGGHQDVGVPSRTLPAQDVYLPGVSVYLEDAQGNTVGRRVRTDLSGRFTLYAEVPDRYRICWKAPGFVPGCEGKVFALGGEPVFASTILIPIVRVAHTVVFVGQVTMGDGSSPRLLEPMSNINAFATVTLLDANGHTRYSTPVNDFGDYLIPQVPIRRKVSIRAKIENGSFTQNILPEAELNRDGVFQLNLRIANSPPRLEPLVPLDSTSGRRVELAAAGAGIRLNAVAHDRDGDPLVYFWELPSGSGSLSATNVRNVTWQLPSVPGQYVVTAIAWDRKGGYARMPLFIRADGGGVPFSGIVRENSGAVVGQADVEVNGQRVATDAGGAFHARVPAAARYVFNIRKPSYAFYSKIYDRGVIGGSWTLTRATVQTVDPAQPIKVVNRREPGDCPGPRSARLDWRTFAHARIPQWQDRKGTVIFPVPHVRHAADERTGAEEQRAGEPDHPPLPWEVKHGECGPGIEVSIPANVLVDADGNPPAGNVEVSLSTVDLMSPEQMPGDDTVVLSGGDTRVMQTFGAGMIEITANAKRYNLKPGSQAAVRIPVDGTQLAAGGPIPATIPILFYDEVAGVWHEEGQATLTGTGAARAYVADVKHFSAINADTLKSDQACVRVLSPQPGMPATYNLEVTIPQPNGNAPKVKAILINNAPPSEHVIYNLPINTNIVLVPTSIVPNTTPIGIFIVNTGQKQNPTSPNLPAGPPYTACSTQVTLSQQAIPDAPLSGEFLHGLFSFAATDLDELSPADPNQNQLKTALDQATADYYAQIDPRGKRSNLTAFRQTNGFIDAGGTPQPGVVNTKYANSGDLGFGRDMYCKKQQASDNQFDYACYVSNYGDVTTADQQDAIDAVTGGPPVATVAMEYSRIESPSGTASEFDDVTNPIRTVKFYVFTPAGGLQRAAKLDGKGARPVPQLCQVCHGGALPHAPTTVNGSPVPVFSTRDDVKLGSRFLPFDLRYFTFPPAPNDKADPNVQAAFKQLNQDIVANVSLALPETAIKEVIDAMYQGGAAAQIEDFVVAGWSAPVAPEPAKATFYKGMVSNACRMCHTAQPFALLRFATANDFVTELGAVGSRVCNQHVMPHSKRTHDIFWGISDPTVVVHNTVPLMPAQLQVFGSQFGAPADWVGVGNSPPTYKCGTSFTSGGATPLSFYEQTIQPLWSGPYGCVACHPGQTGSGGLGLGSGFSYNDLVGVNSTELPTMQRVKKSDSGNSYLFHKLVGDQGSIGGSGSRMPLGCSGSGCVNGTDMSTIQNWIDVRGADGP